MKVTEAMKRLKAAGTAQNRKVYARHGATGDMFGVSYAVLGKLQKEIKVDHALALALWETGNHDARILATHIADPSQVKAAEADAWVKSCDDHVVAAALSRLLAKSPVGARRAARWSASKGEFLSTCGWNIRASLADQEETADSEFDEWLSTIEAGIHAAPNRTRYAMNQTLITIGSRGGSWMKKAIAVAKRIGVVDVDHGETGCKTPFAPTYIQKVVAHREELAAKRKAKAAGKKAPKKRVPAKG